MHAKEARRGAVVLLRLVERTQDQVALRPFDRLVIVQRRRLV